MKSKLFFVGSAVLSFLLATNVVLAAGTATVNATVTVQNISVTVADGTVAFGTLGLDATTTTVVLTDTQTVTNAGNIAEDFNIKGSNSTNWTLATTSAGSEIFTLKFSTTTSPTYSTDYTPLDNTIYTTLATNKSASATSSLDLGINTPTATAFYTTQSFTVTVQAVAH